ncbi:ABC transporter ATP-binding protein [Tenggerimyces flavus]|uniref:ABC transporter ATP-binding protein n=1 Tax=Tenggerimyces flavus TaxID=1708749 RepID=A0ABV7YA80_9ACTN|nr:ABC transporter ATP-binding protein [Tenggerimyces flavus]MBM7789067.1 peptide/nickel transport system ATP-binding protein [Tenggerimyces flavus]
MAESNGTPLLEVSGATKIYKKGKESTKALDDVDLVLSGSPATITTIAGESGSGKTTLADTILGFTKLTDGTVRYRGQDIQRLPKDQRLEYRREVQAVFQDPFGVYNPFYKIRHIFDVAIKRFRLASNDNAARDLIEDALSVVGMRGDEVLDKHPHQLSGGQRQRMMVARAYLLKPRLIVADEPVSMVDASLRAMILDIMLRLRDEHAISFLYITHDLSTAYQIGDDICILYRGEIVERGDTQRVIDDPQHSYSKLLISSIPVPDPDVVWDTSAVTYEGN